MIQALFDILAAYIIIGGFLSLINVYNMRDDEDFRSYHLIKQLIIMLSTCLLWPLAIIIAHRKS